VWIEPGLRSSSPKNGYISNIGRRRLSAFLTRKRPNPQPGDWLLNRKSPPMAGFSRVAEGNYLQAPDWLAGHEQEIVRDHHGNGRQSTQHVERGNSLLSASHSVNCQSPLTAQSCSHKTLLSPATSGRLSTLHLTHSNVRASKFKRPGLMRESIIGPWHFGHAGISITPDEMCDCDAGMMLQAGAQNSLSPVDAEDEPMTEPSWSLRSRLSGQYCSHSEIKK
jgi:hypothetical protein